MNAILDTSVLVDWQGVPGPAVPDGAAVSVVTLAELQLGVLLADTDAVRVSRLRNYLEVIRAFDALVVDADIANAYAALVADARRRGRRPKAFDGLIAATALVRGLRLYTRDADFDAFPGVDVVRL